MPCLMQLKKTECPMCRKEFPMEITKLLHKSKTQNQFILGFLGAELLNLLDII